MEKANSVETHNYVLCEPSATQRGEVVGTTSAHKISLCVSPHSDEIAVKGSEAEHANAVGAIPWKLDHATVEMTVGGKSVRPDRSEVTHYFGSELNVKMAL